jgi:DNA polymerase-4
MPRLRQYQGRGVITTASYAARAFGIGSGMGLMKAAARCPEAILLAADFERYRDYSRRFKALILAQGLQIEDRGIDEIYIDLSHCKDIEEAAWLSRELQTKIFQTTGLSCSIGLAPNKLLAKIASDLQKPSGLSILTHALIEEKLWPLPVSRLHGVGPRTAAKLHALGLHTIAQLAQSKPIALQSHLGAAHSRWLVDASWGIDERPLVLSSEPLSMSRETTLERDMHPKWDRKELGAVFTRLCQQLADDLQQKERLCRGVSGKIRNDQFKTSTRNVRCALSRPSTMPPTYATGRVNVSNAFHSIAGYDYWALRRHVSLRSKQRLPVLLTRNQTCTTKAAIQKVRQQLALSNLRHARRLSIHFGLSLSQYRSHL